MDLGGSRLWILLEPGVGSLWVRSQFWVLVDFSYESWWIQMVMVNPVGSQWWILVDFSYGSTR